MPIIKTKLLTSLALESQVPSSAVKSSQLPTVNGEPNHGLIGENEVSQLPSQQVPSFDSINSQQPTDALTTRQVMSNDKMYNASFRHDANLRDRLENYAKSHKGRGGKFSLNNYLTILVDEDLKKMGY